MAGIFANALETITELSTIHAIQYLEPIWKGVHEQLQKLHRSLVFIQPLVEDAEERQLTDQAVRCWLLLLKDAVYDAEDILDEAKTHELLIQRKAELCGRPRSKGREFFSLDCNPLLFQLQLGKKLRNINERINGLIEEMDKFKLRVVDNNSRPLRNRPQTYSYVHESRVILGRDENKEELLQMLISDCFEEKVAVVSIVGMGGLGKTTLAQLVYGDERVKKHFEPCIWVCVSDDFDVPRLAGKILHTASGANCDHTNIEVLQQELRKKLGQKRYLLVLDDVWNEDFQKWDALRNMLLDGGKGSRILVTTRNEKCSRLMGAQKPYILSRLSEESSRVLFEQKAFATGAPKPSKLVEIGKKIVEKCQGLPLAIEVLGCIMQFKSEESEWQAVLENQNWKLQHTQNEIMPELWLSYVDLPTHLKKCFAFCAIFPKNYGIEEEKLIQFWMAHRFIPSQNGNDMEVEGREILTELIRRSLLQYHHYSHLSTTPTVCKMHDLIYDMAHFVMENECFTSLKSGAATKISGRPRHLYLHAIENCKQGGFSIIRTVVCRHQQDYSLMSKLKLVRVLDLSYAKLDELPASVGHLHHLRYLDICNTRIMELPEFICMLANLQTLILCGCSELSKLPKSIIYMKSIRHLRFDCCPQLKVLPAGLSRLQNLKTLTSYTVGDDTENNIRQLKLLNLGGKVELYNLQKVKSADDAREANLGHKQNIDTLILNWKEDKFLGANKYCSMENAEEVLDALKPHNGVKVLEVSHYPGKQFPMWMREKQQFQYLHKMELLGCRDCEQLPPLEILPCLEDLSISQMDGIKHIVNNSRGNVLQSFPALKKLTLIIMINLERWCMEDGGEANMPLFPCLIQKKITECPKLTTMPSIPTLQELSMVSYSETQISPMPMKRGFFKHLKSLRSLTINLFTDELALLLGDEEEIRAMKSSLESLDIEYCNQLSLTLVLQNFTTLRKLCVKSLGNLVSWPDEMRGLKSLDTLTIISCKNFTGVSSQGDCAPPFLKSLQVLNCHALRELPMCPKSLESLFIIHCSAIETLWPEMGHLTSLSFLWLYLCPKLVSLSDAMQGLTSLQFLFLEDCPALKSFPKSLQLVLPTLKTVSIKGCPELERLCKPGGDYYNLLRTILVKRIGKAQPKQTLQVPYDQISTGAKQALRCIAPKRFLLSAILICVLPIS